MSEIYGKIIHLGIDIGSTTLKLCAVDSNGRIVHTDYRRHNAGPAHVAEEALGALRTALGDVAVSATLTGSVGMGYAERLSLPFEQEVLAAAKAVRHLAADVSTFIDIGGEDSKMIFFDEGRVPDMRMNGNCAGGTGSFIDQTATLLGVETAELDALAAKATTVYPIASRCGVFSKTDIQNLLARNVSKADIAASMFRAVALQVVSALARGVEVKPRVFLCGDPFAFLPQLRRHIGEVLQLSEDDLVVPQYPQLVPALGCALAQAEGTPASVSELTDRFRLTASAVSDGTAATASALEPLFADQADYDRWIDSKRGFEVPQSEGLPAGDYYLGVDSGSTTTKLVLVDAEGRMAYRDYLFNRGDSYSTFRSAIEKLRTAAADPAGVNIVASAATGYGESLLRTAFGLDHGLVETMAHYTAAQAVDPDVSFVLDIGGQDMKAIFVDNGSIRRIEINEACSSGCGSFIMTFANQLGYSIGAFAKLACFARHPYDLGTRCTVFMNSKVKQAMREGAEVADIAAGFSYSVIKNCLFKVLKLRTMDEMGSHIVVQGGTFKNHSVVRALERLTGHAVSFTDYPELAGAYGAALYALKKS